MAYQSNTLSMRQQNRGQEARQVNPVRTVNPAKPYSKWNEKHETELRHREVLLMSLAFPIGIMMAFGGKPALIVLCFGGIISYIFDLLGTVEVSIHC
jgi:hypothetical protein